MAVHRYPPRLTRRAVRCATAMATSRVLAARAGSVIAPARQNALIKHNKDQTYHGMMLHGAL
jgi:hypothetical protein